MSVCACVYMCVHWEFFICAPLDRFHTVLLIVVLLVLFDYLPTPAVRDFHLSSRNVDLRRSIETLAISTLDSPRMLRRNI